MKKSKGYQLRVRISSEAHQGLNKAAVHRGKNESLSDMVREGIARYLDSQEGSSLQLSGSAWQVLKDLALETGRSPVRIVEECIDGILGLLEEDLSPLIVEEIKLRRKYASKTEAKNRDGSAPVRSRKLSSPSRTSHKT